MSITSLFSCASNEQGCSVDFEQRSFFSFIVLTNFYITFGRHIIVADKTDVFEAWQIDWMCRFDELMGEPRTEGERLVLNVRVRL